MRKIILSFSTALLISTPAFAINCQVETNCASLGYTSSSDEGNCLKCPFGDQWACPKCEETSDLDSCKIGDVLYSDMTCSPNIIVSKTPIGVVFDVTNKLAIGLEEADEDWSNFYFDVPSLSNITSESAVKADWKGKNNTKVVLEYCKTNGKSCPAFEYVNSYQTEGTKSGDWYLPAMGELIAIVKNLDTLNATLTRLAATKIDNYDMSGHHYWSSSEHSSSSAWLLSCSGLDCDGSDITDHTKSNNWYVRPVIQYPVFHDGETEPSESNCQVGDILYSDKSCSTDVVSGKTPIGVVFDATKRLAIALEQTTNTIWSAHNFDIPDISISVPLEDFGGKSNTQIISEYCQSNNQSCPAVEYVNSYKTEGTISGDWYLPAMGELNLIYSNKSILNETLGKVAGSTLSIDYYWSSSEFLYNVTWCLSFFDGRVNNNSKTMTHPIRPVIAY